MIDSRRSTFLPLTTSSTHSHTVKNKKEGVDTDVTCSANRLSVSSDNEVYFKLLAASLCHYMECRAANTGA